MDIFGLHEGTVNWCRAGLEGTVDGLNEQIVNWYSF